jgi:thiosulfate reductase / polysulfide reductase chain A
MNSLSRRRFLKISGTTIAAAAAVSSAGSIIKGAKKVEEKTGKIVKGIQKIPTFCDICFWKCAAMAYVKDGELWKIEGNPNDPLSKGRLCPRGTGGIGVNFSKDRLKSPLIRKSIRGEEKWVEVTWGEALEHIAEKMKTIKSKYGPESMALFSHGSSKFFNHMLYAYGSRNATAPAYAQCRGPREMAFQLTFGDWVHSPERTDIENAKCITLIGSHLGENMHNTQVQEFSHAVENGATIIVVDPRFSVAASKAKYYLPIKPGTDMALILAWMNVIVKEKLYDADYVEKYGFGFEQFAAEIEENTPEWASPITGIDPQLIRDTAHEIARYKPASLVHPGRHTTWYGDDTQRSRAIALLNALLGSWGRKGGFYIPHIYSIPKYKYKPYPAPSKPNVDNPNNKYPFITPGSPLSTGIRDATISGKPYPVKGWFVYATNLLACMPNQEETIKAIQNLDLLVVADIVPSEIAGWADVVLPESTYLERYDELNTEPFKTSFVSLRQPVVESPNDQKPSWWIAKKLGEKLGLKEYFPWKNAEEYLDTRLKGAGLSLAEMKKKGVVTGDKEPIYFEDGIKPAFRTPSGKIEFYSLQLKEKGFDPVPKFTPPEEPPPGFFRLLFGRAPVHTFSKTQSYRYLKDLMPENEVWINKNIADKFGLKSGDRIKLKNTDDIVTDPVLVKATERIRTDCVYMVHGFGQQSKALRSTYKVGASDSQLCTNYKMDPIMGGTGMNVNFVTIESEA